jgi:hypothetical protein
MVRVQAIKQLQWEWVSRGSICVVERGTFTSLPRKVAEKAIRRKRARLANGPGGINSDNQGKGASWQRL